MKKIIKRLMSFTIIAAMLLSALPVGAAQEDSRRMKVLKEFINVALTEGRNIPGAAEPLLFVEGLNMETHEPIIWKRGGKDRVPAQFMSQQTLLRMLHDMATLTGDESLREIAREQYRYWFANFTDDNGLLKMGCHMFVDVMTGDVISDGNAHEIKSNYIPYHLMFDADPEGAKRYIEAQWNSHVYDFEGMRMNRHGYVNTPMGDLWNSQYLNDDPLIKGDGVSLPFESTANDLIDSAVALAKYTGEEMPLVWAKRLLKKYIDLVDPGTGLGGGQYGLYSDEEGGDRAYAQFGPEYGENCLESTLVNRNTIKQLTAYNIYSYMPFYELTKDEEIRNYVVGEIEGVYDHVYDRENHRLNTPILSDGTSLQGVVAQRDGYYLREGNAFPMHESVFPMTMAGLVRAYKTVPTDKIWQFARDFAKGAELGDIGTEPGVGVDINEDCKVASCYYAIAMADLYDMTGEPQYLEIAEILADNIIDAYYKNGMFSFQPGGQYGQFDSMEAAAVLIVEAASQGRRSEVMDMFGHSNIDMEYDGLGRVYITNTHYQQPVVPTESVSMDRKEISLAVDPNKNYDFSDTIGHWAQTDIRKMASAGVVDGMGDGTFAPDKTVTRAEFVKMINTMCGFNDNSEPLTGYEDITTDDWFYNDAVIAKNTGIIDYHMTNDKTFDGNKTLSREEMASILVGALKVSKPENTYEASGSLYNFTDTERITDWAVPYMDIAYNHRIMNGTSSKTLDPTLPVTRAQAARAIAGLQKIISNEDVVRLTATVMPENASNKLLTWESSNTDVVEVDSEGRIYPVGAGEAEITVTCCDKTDTAKVSVLSTEDWMIKKVYINGVRFEEFEPDKLDYNYDLPIGTKDKPNITAVSYDGSKVIIKVPNKYPGDATLTLNKGGVDPYKISFTANKIEYISNEDYNSYKAGTPLMDSASGGLDEWQVSGDYKTTAQVVAKPTFGTSVGTVENESGETETSDVLVNTGTDGSDMCIEIPYNSTYKYLGEFRAKFGSKAYQTHTACEDENMCLVFDFDVMVEGDGKSFSIRAGSKDYTWAQRITIDSENFFVEGSREIIAPYAGTGFNNVKMVIDKKTLIAKYYFNGELMLENQMPMNMVDNIGIFMIHMPANMDTDAKVYFDNLKIYQVSNDALEESFGK